MNEGKTVFVGLSGGVDSSVAALRLKRAGYKVVGVFIKVWHPDFMVCNWEQERLDAMRVAAHLEIPFLTCNAEQAYKKSVADYFISEYQAGRTPNPDVMCNQAVKFGAFLEYAKQKGADYIATGHYAQKINNKLCRGIDQSKDQSYFLWTLTNEQLSASLFPIGNTEKSQIRKEAAAAGIPTASKRDSQGICFLGHVNIPDFLSHFIELEAGDVLSTTGETIGTHKGALVYTLGQRHGFTLDRSISDRKAMYVVDKDVKNNTLTVGEEPPVNDKNASIMLTNAVLREPIAPDASYQVQLRYHGEPIDCLLSESEDGVSVTSTEPYDIPAAGQSCVIYSGNLCIGGGVVA